MANTKEYSIKINGLQESIKQVDALSDSLQFLEQRIKNLEGKAVNLGGSSNGSSTKALQEQDKLLKQIQETEQKIRDARREDYQSLLAAKDILKDATESAKERAAAERLSANSYANTMKGMKEELADIKRVMQSTDLGSDKFKELTSRANTLNDKLKDIEQSYGQFGRNVGNYKSAFDGMKKITVTVGGVAREFNSVRDASRQLSQELAAMVINGQENTKEFDDLASAVHDFEMAEKRAQSAMNDLKTSSKWMDNLLDTMQSMAAIGSTVKGFSALFGFDSDELEKSIQKLVALQNVLQGIEKIKQQMNTQEGIGKYLAIGSDKIDDFVSSITGAEKGMNGLVKGGRNATIAVRGLSVALKGIGLGAAIAVIYLAINAFKSLQESIWNTKIKTDLLTESEKALDKSYEDRKNLINSAYFKENISSEQMLVLQYKNEVNYLEQQLSLLQKRADIVNDKSWFGEMLNALDPSGTYGGQFTGRHMNQEGEFLGGGHWMTPFFSDWGVTVKNIEEVENAIRICNEALKENTDYLSYENEELEKAGRATHDWFEQLLATSAGTYAIKEGLERLRLSEYIAKINDFQDAWKSGAYSEEEVSKKLRELVKEMDNNEILNSIIANLDKIIPEEDVRKRIEGIINQIRSLDDAFNSVSAEQIRYWAGVEADAMADGWAKTKKQLDAERAYEISQHGKTKEQIAKINAKYDRKEKDARKQYNAEWQSSNNELTKLRIDNMKDGLKKQLATLEQERNEKIQAAIKTEKNVGELRVEINKLYDQKILKAREDWAHKMEETYRNMWRSIHTMAHNNASMEYETQLRDIEITYTKLKEKADGIKRYMPSGVYLTNTARTMREEREYTEQLGKQFDRRFEEYQRYYAEVEKLMIDEENKKFQIEKEKATEQENYELTTLKNSYSAQDYELKQHLEKGEISRKDYNEAIIRLEEERVRQEAAINDKYRATAEQRELEHQRKIKDIRADTSNSLIDELNDYITKLNGMDRNISNKNNKQLKEEYMKVYNQIEAQMAILELRKNSISAEAYEQQKKQLQEQKDITLKQMRELDDIYVNHYDKINHQIQEAGQAATQIMSSLAEIAKNEYDKQISELEKYIDEYEELLDKQAEITENHADKVNSIEDELKTARGDRRQELIDNLNAEMAAQRASLAQEKKIEREKKKMEYEKEMLEWEAAKKEREINLWRAAVNAAMAVSMAAVNKWPEVAIPMMTLAAAVGAAQLAAVASTPLPEKPTPKYADGGVLQGASHAQGGIKVLGGQAEVEGGEYITNRQTTSSNVELLDFINSKRRRIDISDMIEFYNGNTRRNLQANKYKFADGGQLPMLRNDISLNNEVINAMNAYANKPTVVQVVDIVDATDNLNKVKVLSGLQGS